jgi:ferredoxin
VMYASFRKGHFSRRNWRSSAVTRTLASSERVDVRRCLRLELCIAYCPFAPGAICMPRDAISYAGSDLCSRRSPLRIR